MIHSSFWWCRAGLQNEFNLFLPISPILCSEYSVPGELSDGMNSQHWFFLQITRFAPQLSKCCRTSVTRVMSSTTSWLVSFQNSIVPKIYCIIVPTWTAYRPSKNARICHVWNCWCTTPWKSTLDSDRRPRELEIFFAVGTYSCFGPRPSSWQRITLCGMQWLWAARFGWCHLIVGTSTLTSVHSMTHLWSCCGMHECLFLQQR